MRFLFFLRHYSSDAVLFRNVSVWGIWIAWIIMILRFVLILFIIICYNFLKSAWTLLQLYKEEYIGDGEGYE